MNNNEQPDFYYRDEVLDNKDSGSKTLYEVKVEPYKDQNGEWVMIIGTYDYDRGWRNLKEVSCSDYHLVGQRKEKINIMENFKKLPKKWLVTGIVVVGLLIAAFGIYGYMNGLQKGAVGREVPISRSYESMKSELDAFLSKAREQAGVTKANSTAFDKIMLDAVSGRYQGKEGSPTTAQPGSGTMFSAIVEQYPDLSGINNSYNRLLDTISEGRTAFNNAQHKLQDQLREYDVWRSSGLFHSWALRTFIGVPTNNLVAVNEQKLTGQAAYDKISRVIVSGLTSEAFNTGTLEAQDFMGN